MNQLDQTLYWCRALGDDQVVCGCGTDFRARMIRYLAPRLRRRWQNPDKTYRYHQKADPVSTHHGLPKHPQCCRHGAKSPPPFPRENAIFCQHPSEECKTMSSTVLGTLNHDDLHPLRSLCSDRVHESLWTRRAPFADLRAVEYEQCHSPVHTRAWHFPNENTAIKAHD